MQASEPLPRKSAGPLVSCALSYEKQAPKYDHAEATIDRSSDKHYINGNCVNDQQHHRHAAGDAAHLVAEPHRRHGCRLRRSRFQ